MAKYVDYISRMYQRAFELAFNTPPGGLSPPVKKWASDEEISAAIQEEIDRLFPEGEEGAKTSDRPLTEGFEAMFNKSGEKDRDRLD